jgi:hypothetical protein
MARDIEYSSISPLGWGLGRAGDRDAPALAAVGLGKEDLENRARQNTYQWLPLQFDPQAGAFHGYYDARGRTWAPPQTVNLIAPFQCLAAFDRYQDQRWLDMARSAAQWLEAHMVETHPMSLVLGGVKDNIKPAQLWTKYTADYVVLNLGLCERTKDGLFLRRAIAGSRFLLQAQNHKFACKYDQWHESWQGRGWQSFGRVVVAMIALHEFTGEPVWLEWAKAWGEHGLTLQAHDGGFYLINDCYYSSDIAADELRALVRLYRRFDDRRFLDAAIRFADWHVQRQHGDGTWPLSEDRYYGYAVTEYAGPGDMPNIAIALLLMHKVTGDARYVVSAIRALRYSLTQQQLPEGPGRPYGDDPATHWGFWSWDPPYDFTMSADQSTHHCRGYWFFLDYMLSLPDKELARIEKLTAERDRPEPTPEPGTLAPTLCASPKS